MRRSALANVEAADDEGLRIVLSPVQLARIFEGRDMTEGETVRPGCGAAHRRSLVLWN